MVASIPSARAAFSRREDRSGDCNFSAKRVTQLGFSLLCRARCLYEAPACRICDVVVIVHLPLLETI